MITSLILLNVALTANEFRYHPLGFTGFFQVHLLILVREFHY